MANPIYTFKAKCMNVDDVYTTRNAVNNLFDTVEMNLAAKKKDVAEVSHFYRQSCLTGKFDPFNLQRAHESVMESMYELEQAQKDFKTMNVEATLCFAFCNYVEYVYSKFEETIAEIKVKEAIVASLSLTSKDDILTFWNYYE
jgi:hypothetical protein